MNTNQNISLKINKKITYISLSGSRKNNGISKVIK